MASLELVSRDLQRSMTVSPTFPPMRLITTLPENREEMHNLTTPELTSSLPALPLMAAGSETYTLVESEISRRVSLLLCKHCRTISTLSVARRQSSDKLGISCLLVLFVPFFYNVSRF